MTLAAGDTSQATAIFIVEFLLLQSKKMPLGHSFFQKRHLRKQLLFEGANFAANAALSAGYAESLAGYCKSCVQSACQGQGSLSLTI